MIAKNGSELTPVEMMDMFLSCDDFVGGGLIEYCNNSGFRREYARANIVGFDKADGNMNFKTDNNRAFLKLCKETIKRRMFSVDMQNGAFGLSIPHMWNYVIYPAKLASKLKAAKA